jgi:hypothetical protein
LFVESEAVQLHGHVPLDGLELLQTLVQLLVALLRSPLLLLPLAQVGAQI